MNSFFAPPEKIQDLTKEELKTRVLEAIKKHDQEKENPKSEDCDEDLYHLTSPEPSSYSRF